MNGLPPDAQSNDWLRAYLESPIPRPVDWTRGFRRATPFDDREPTALEVSFCRAPETTPPDDAILDLLVRMAGRDLSVMEISQPRPVVGSALRAEFVIRPDKSACTYRIFDKQDNEPTVVTTSSHSLKQLRQSSSALKVALEPMVAAGVHRAERRHIFVSNDEALLRVRDDSGLRSTNILTPAEGIKLAGLFLRSRHDFRAGPSVRLQEAHFYELLTDFGTPNLLRYAVACRVLGRESNNARLVGLADAVVGRYSRMLQARDRLGLAFLAQRADALSESLYHFEYLGLLTVGLLDAQCRILRAAYSLEVRERNISLWTPEFQKALPAAGLQPLYDLLTSAAFKDLTRIIRAMRNQIHAEELAGYSSSTTSIRTAYFEVPADELRAVMDAVERLGGHQAWGVKQLARGDFEPYAFAIRLTTMIGVFAEAIARESRIEKRLSNWKWTYQPDIPEREARWLMSLG